MIENLGFLFNYINPIILGICLMAGYAFKVAFEKFPNKYIPLSALVLGVIISILINLGKDINAEVVIGGMISGLASTGLYEMLRNLLSKDGKKDSEGA